MGGACREGNIKLCCGFNIRRQYGLYGEKNMVTMRALSLMERNLLGRNDARLVTGSPK